MLYGSQLIHLTKVMNKKDNGKKMKGQKERDASLPSVAAFVFFSFKHVHTHAHTHTHTYTHTHSHTNIHTHTRTFPHHALETFPMK